MYAPGALTWYCRLTDATPSRSVTLAVTVTGWFATGWDGPWSTCRTAGAELPANTEFDAPGVGSADRQCPPRLLSRPGLTSWIDPPVPGVWLAGLIGSPTVGQGNPAPYSTSSTRPPTAVSSV